jgi:hypothetical protein
VHGFHDGTDRRDVGEWWGFFLADAQKTKKLAIPQQNIHSSDPIFTEFEVR